MSVVDNHSAEMMRCLEECDVVAIRKLWRHIALYLHQPATDHEAEATIHRARTEMPSMRFRLRAYSHRWLVDNGYPSALPDELRPRAERIYPSIVEGVGIAVKTSSPIKKIILEAMSVSVLDAYTEKIVNPIFVKERIMAAREKTIKKLFG